MHSRMQIAGIEGDAVTNKYLRLAKKGKLPAPGIIAANKIRARKLRRCVCSEREGDASG
jgi:hypothetical protein